jgi:glutathione S-transferase
MIVISKYSRWSWLKFLDGLAISNSESIGKLYLIRNSPGMAALNLYYWPLRGLNEPIVTLLEYLKVKYVFHKINSREEWAAKKEALIKQGVDFPNLPYIEHDGKIISESLAILTYIATEVANRPEMVPLNEDGFTRFLQLDGIISDLNQSITRPAYACKTPDDFKAHYLAAVETNRQKIEGLNNLVGKQKWLLGKDISVIDFKFAELIEKMKTIETDIEVDLISQYENLDSFMGRVLGLPEIKNYRSSDRFSARPYNGFTAIWK